MDPKWAVAGERVVLRLWPSALTFLNDVLTQEVGALAPGQSAIAALLNEKGRIRAIVRVLAGEDAVTVVAEPASLPGLEAGIVHLAPLAGVEVEVSTRQAFFTSEAPSADVLAVPVPGGWEIIVDSWRGTSSEDAAFFEAARIEAGIPRFGVDVDEDTLINETPLVDLAVSFTKGCYPGQESVAKVHNLGSVRRFLRVLAVDGPPPPRGAHVTAGDHGAGTVTSAAAGEHGSVALAMLRSECGPGTSVLAGDAPATVER